MDLKKTRSEGMGYNYLPQDVNQWRVVNTVEKFYAEH
jgi:hypothetical protein